MSYTISTNGIWSINMAPWVQGLDAVRWIASSFSVPGYRAWKEYSPSFLGSI